MKRFLTLFLGSGCLCFSLLYAQPPGINVFCTIYPNIPACEGGQTSCATCHTEPPARNAYGDQVQSVLAPSETRPLSDETYALALPEALRSVEALDADSDSFSNIEELNAGSSLINSSNVPTFESCTAEEQSLAAAHPEWNVCAYDPNYAFKKVMLDFCGHSPTRTQAHQFSQEADWQVALAQTLSDCLNSEYWLGEEGVLWNLANTKIVPAAAIKSGEDPGEIPLADYEDDYNLFIYTQIDNQDARELLTAQYFVKRSESNPLRFETFNVTPVRDALNRGNFVGQLVTEERRAGMLTTRWFLTNFVMFTSIPRTAAAQAYRAYLGHDIAKMEGLQSVASEPIDYDNKNVTQAACAVCHATLDPLTYPFSRYHGLPVNVSAIVGTLLSTDNQYVSLEEGGEQIPILDFVGADGSVNLGFAHYAPARLEDYTEIDGSSITNTPEAGVLLGQPVSDLLQWAQVAANSDDFAKKLVLDYWELLLGEAPSASEVKTFQGLWQSFKTTHNYQVEALLHAFILTEAYGQP